MDVRERKGEAAASTDAGARQCGASTICRTIPAAASRARGSGLTFFFGDARGKDFVRGVAAMTDKEAGRIAHGLIQGYIGPDHRIRDMASFYRALVQTYRPLTSEAGKIARKQKLSPGIKPCLA
jgi:hypothetical protein